MITSKQNQHVKLVNDLQNKTRARRKESKIVLEGTRLIQDAITYKVRPDYILYTPTLALGEFIMRLANEDVRIYEVSEDLMRYMSDTKNPQGILGVFHLPKPTIPSEPVRVLILDAIREPGNMGTILRTAGAAGIELVILVNCVDPYNPKCIRGGMGAHLRVPIVEASWQEIQAFTENMEVSLASGSGDLAYMEIDWTAPWALVIGNEAHGIGEEAIATADHHIYIPMESETESLNAAIATGVILFEAQRQRQTARKHFD